MENLNVPKSSFPGLSDVAYSAAVKERDRRLKAGLKSSISAVVSEAVIKVFGRA